MTRIEILNPQGEVINTVIGTEAWAEQHHPGAWRLAPALPEPEPISDVPTTCTRRQGRLALHQLGLLDAAEAAIESIEDPDQKRTAQIEYEADTWERSNAFVQQLWASLGGTPEGLDEAFELAVTL